MGTCMSCHSEIRDRTEGMMEVFAYTRKKASTGMLMPKRSRTLVSVVMSIHITGFLEHIVNVNDQDQEDEPLSSVW